MAVNESNDDRTQSFVPLTAGTKISHYKIIERIGTGGMGEVYLAKDTKLNRKVALKFLASYLSGDRNYCKRFAHEAQAVANLDHPNILTIYEISEFRGRPFFSMRFQTGNDLRHLISEKEIPLEQAIEIIMQACEGIEEAHTNGVIHRDLKPANIIVSPEGRVKILDFGLAKITGNSLDTITGSLMGTVNYMSPEQVQGMTVDRRTDIFSIGIIFYELLTGVNPFDRGSVPVTINAIMTEIPKYLYLYRHTIPSECQSIIDRALAKDPNERYQTVTELITELKLLRTKYTSLESDEVSSLSLTPVSKPGSQISIAVLPFVNMSPDPENDYFAEGLSEELLNILTKISSLRVAARTSSFIFKNSKEDIRFIGNKLNVNVILEGSVRKSDGRVRITVQLVKVADGYHLWSETYDRTLDDILVVQDNIARSVVRKLTPMLSGGKVATSTTDKVENEIANAVLGRGENAEAHRLYLLGQYFAERLTQIDVEKATDCFQRVVELDPLYALAWTGLSRVYADKAGHGWMSCDEGFKRSRATAEKALEIEPNLAEGYMRLALIRMSYDWDWEGALSAIQRALELEPGSVTVLRTAAHLSSNLSHLDEAITLMRRVIMLDPLNSTAYHSLGIYCYSADRLDEAETALKTSLELNPQQVGLWLDNVRVHIAQGFIDQALVEAEKEVFEPFRLLALSLAHHATGNDQKSDHALNQLIEKYYVDGAYQIAEALSFKGDIDGAFEWLEKAFQQRDPGLPEMVTEPLLRALHGDSRWKGMLDRLGFTKHLSK